MLRVPLSARQTQQIEKEPHQEAAERSAAEVQLKLDRQHDRLHRAGGRPVRKEQQQRAYSSLVADQPEHSGLERAHT